MASDSKQAVASSTIDASIFEAEYTISNKQVFLKSNTIEV